LEAKATGVCGRATRAASLEILAGREVTGVIGQSPLPEKRRHRRGPPVAHRTGKHGPAVDPTKPLNRLKANEGDGDCGFGIRQADSFVGHCEFWGATRTYRTVAATTTPGTDVWWLAVFICYLLFAICYSFEPKARMTLWTPASSRNSALLWETAA
jgi:hypothetical protein